MLLLTAALALSWSPQQAEAQTTPQTLVSNLGQTDDTSGGDTFDHAQAFTSGDNATGYILTSVDIYFQQIANVQYLSHSEVTIRSDSSGSPGTVLATLTDPPSRIVSAESLTFTVPGQGLHLDPNTQYWLVLDLTGSISQLNTIGNTSSDAEDAGAASGWSIHNQGHYRTSGSTGSWTTIEVSRIISINGDVRDPLPECDTASDGAYIVPADWQLHPQASTPASASG